MGTNKVREEYSISAFTLGIISITSMLFYYVSIPASILAIVLGIKEFKNSKSKIALTGFILGLVGIGLTGLVNGIFLLRIIFQMI